MTEFRLHRSIPRFGLIAAALLGSLSASQASVEISDQPTSNMTCSGGVCAPTAKLAVLNTTDLANMLATADVKVATGNGATTITVASPLSWASSHSLTLDAQYNVSFKAQVAVAGQGGVTVITNDGGSGGDLIFFTGGKIDFSDLTSALTINGNTYTLVNSIHSLAAAVAANTSGFFALANDYDASQDGTYRTPTIEWIGGIFEGLGHTISNLSIVRKDGGVHRPSAGLFSYSTGLLRDITLAQATLTSTHPAGILAGENGGTIIRCSVTGSVTGGLVGGLVGSNSGTITQSNANATISDSGSDATIGGMVGENSGAVTSSHSGGIVSAIYESREGGLIGVNTGIVALSSSSAVVSATSEHGNGGLISANYGSISQSYATGGALVEGNSGSITQSYATGSSSGGWDGGLVAGNTGSITQSYSIGAVATRGGGFKMGGLIGNDSSPTGSISDAYWDLDTSNIKHRNHGAGNIKNDPGITGLTNAELKSGLPDGFDAAIWGQKRKVNGGYPYLLANPPQ